MGIIERIEFEKCKEDITYFAEHYIKLSTINGPSLYDSSYNDGLLGKLYNDKTLLVAPRQIGKSTISMITALHAFIFNENERILYVGNKMHHIRDTRQELNRMHNSLPLWMQVEFEQNDREVMRSATGSVIMFIMSRMDIGGLDLQHITMCVIDIYGMFDVGKYLDILSSDTVNVFWTSPHNVDLRLIDMHYFDKYVFNIKDVHFFNEEWKEQQIEWNGTESYNLEYQT